MIPAARLRETFAMPTLKQVRTAADNKLAELWPKMVSFQDSFFAAKGRYWQGLYTHQDEPELKTAGVKADRLDRHPTDQEESWRDVGSEILALLDDIPLPFRFRQDVYVANEGQGWQATVQVKYDGTIYQRSKGVGPLAERLDFEWEVFDRGGVDGDN